MGQTNKLKTDAGEIGKYTAGLFFALIIYAFTAVRKFELPSVEGVAYLFHCVDYSLGFCSRFLPGSVYNIFVKEPSAFSATVFETALLLIFLCLSAFLLAKWLLSVRANTEYGRTAEKLLFLFMTGSCTFAVFSCQIGMLDVYWFFFSVIFFFLVQSRVGRFFIPGLMLLCPAVHYGAIMNFVPLFALVLLYEALSAEEKKEKKIWTVIFTVSCAAAIISFAYFVIFDKSNVRYDIYTFDSIVKERGSDMTRYFDYALFGNSSSMEDYLKVSGNYELFANVSHLPGVTDASPFLFRLIDNVWLQAVGHLSLYRLGGYGRVFIEAVLLLLVLSPVLAMFAGFMGSRIKQSGKNVEKKIFYIFALVFFPFAAAVSLLISTDSIRWISHGFAAQFVLILYIIYRGKGEGLGYFKKCFSGVPPFAVTVYFIIYALTVFDPYV